MVGLSDSLPWDVDVDVDVESDPGFCSEEFVLLGVPKHPPRRPIAKTAETKVNIFLLNMFCSSLLNI